jgi:hypothetical protein
MFAGQTVLPGDICTCPVKLAKNSLYNCPGPNNQADAEQGGTK